MRDIRVALIDGYIDDPAALGVPPYISPMVRSIAGAAIDAGAVVTYIPIDTIRKGKGIPKVDVSVVLSGNNVPGKYLRSMPMSLKELESLIPKLTGWKLIGGSSAEYDIAQQFNFSIKTDIAASLYDGLIGKEVNERFRTLDEWNKWMILGAEIVTQHPDFPNPLIAEIETYRGCHRYLNGGCSYCIEPLKGKPLTRSPQDIIEEARKLKEYGVRNIRVGGQTCIISYGTEDCSSVPCPNPDKLSELFEGLKKLEFDILHVDNANPAVISTYPCESTQILETLVECCTSGNILALGMESVDPIVIEKNNLNSTQSQTLEAIRLVNKIGKDRGDNGLPKLLPGLNIICGLDGESNNTYDMNMKVLEQIMSEDLMIRRINIRQVLPFRREFDTKIDQKIFKTFKSKVRTNVDRPMLERIVPKGTIMKNVFSEIHDGKTTFGRQIGTYPLLVGIPYRLDLNNFYDIIITDWGFRSVTGIEYPFKINHMPLSAIETLPQIGKRRAASIFLKGPYASIEELKSVIDVEVADELNNFITFE